jgi:hypothetical protein
MNLSRGIKELPDDSEGRLKMKAASFQWFSIAMYKSIHVSDTVQLAVFTQINMEFNITEESAALMPMKGTTTCADLN